MNLQLAPLRLAPLIDWLALRMRVDYDNVVVVDGPKGTGKSSVALLIARAICKQTGQDFTPERDVYLTPESYLRGLGRDIEAGRHGVVRQVDEGANVAYIASHMTFENRTVNQIMLQNRELHNTELWLAPSVRDLDPRLIRSHVKARIQLRDRRVARVGRLRIADRTSKEWWEWGDSFEVPDIGKVDPGLKARYEAVKGTAKVERIEELIGNYFTRKEQQEERVARRRSYPTGPRPEVAALRRLGGALDDSGPTNAVHEGSDE